MMRSAKSGAAETMLGPGGLALRAKTVVPLAFLAGLVDFELTLLR